MVKNMPTWFMDDAFRKSRWGINASLVGKDVRYNTEAIRGRPIRGQYEADEREDNGDDHLDDFVCHMPLSHILSSRSVA